jgi:flagellar basal-body rod protein FlgG
MKLKNFATTLICPLVFSCLGASLFSVFAANTPPAVEEKLDSAAVGSNFLGHVLLPGNTNEIRLLAAALRHQRLAIEVIANNLANIDTTGFKENQLRFQDQTSDGAGLTTSLNGAEPVLVERLFTQGELGQTGNNLDFAIQGSGFFEVQMPDGSLAFTRDGGFKTDYQGRIVTCNGYPVQGGFQPMPAGTSSTVITDGGKVTYLTSSGVTTFQVQLARFPNPAALDAMGSNLFKESIESGTPELGNPGNNGFGTIRQGFLEFSNVSLAREIAHLIHAQRVYEATLQAMQTAEKMTPSCEACSKLGSLCRMSSWFCYGP